MITGGSSGVGNALVTVFAQNGDRVRFTYHQGKDRAEKSIHSLSGYDVSTSPLDQGDKTSIEQFCITLPENIDILILNAALGTKTVERYAGSKEGQDEALLRVNALGPQWLVEKILPRMKKQDRGKIIFISSVDGGINHFPNARYSDGMSKAALSHFARQLASELVHSPIDIYTICPGATETPMLTASVLGRLSPSEKARFCDSLPAKRLITPEEIAHLAFFLSSEAGTVLRGSTLDASLGLGNWPAAIQREPSSKDKLEMNHVQPKLN